ncbi:DUF2225 domain-containing protein [Bacteroidota bacterium]
MNKIVISAFLIFCICIQPCISKTWEELIRESNEFLEKGDFESALGLAEKSLNLSLGEENNPQEKHAVSLGEIGQIYYTVGDFPKASEYFLMEKNYKEKVFGKAHESYLLSLNNLSSAYQYLGKLNEAKKILSEALEIIESTSGTESLIYVKTLHNLGKVYHTIGDYEKAENNYLKAEKIKNLLLGENDPVYANTVLNLGILYQNLGNSYKAEKNIRKAIEIYKANYDNDNQTLAAAELQLALLLSSTGRKDEAEKILEKRQEQIIRIKNKSNPDYASGLYNLAMIQWSLSNFEKAEELLLKAKSIIEEQLGKTSSLYASCINSLGIVNWTQGKIDEAYDYLTQVVILRKLFYGNSHPFYATSVHNLAGLLADMKKNDLAEKYYTESLDLSLVLIRTYFPFLSEYEKTRFNEKIQERYNMFFNFVLQNYQQKPDLKSKIFNYRLYTKGILLNTSVKVRKEMLKSENQFLIDEFNTWKKIRDELAQSYSFSKKEAENLGKNIDSLENLANELEKSLSKKSNIFKENYKTPKYSWKDIKRNLKNDEALIEIIRVNSFQKGWTDNVFYFALIVTSETEENPELVVIDLKNDIEKKYINSYNNSIKFKLEDNHSYQTFWAEINDKLKGKSHIYISPDGAYNKINLETIELPNGSYVIDEKTISVISNPLDLLANSEPEQNDRSKNAYLYGYPDFGADLTNIDQKINDGNNTLRSNGDITEELKKLKLSDIPGTKKEVDEIDAILTSNGWQTNKFIADQALKSNIKSINNGNIVHIATHGYFLPDVGAENQNKMFGLDYDKALSNPLLRSGLLFAGAENSINNTNTSFSDNGILTAYEAMNLDLSQTELIVLSACETGLGEIKNGEGVYGLQRAFKIAGAKTIIMSLWKVDDEVTQQFMTIFYKKWLSGSSMRKALKEAQIELKKKHKYPYYWGAFVMVGE